MIPFYFEEMTSHLLPLKGLGASTTEERLEPQHVDPSSSHQALPMGELKPKYDTR